MLWFAFLLFNNIFPFKKYFSLVQVKFIINWVKRWITLGGDLSFKRTGLDVFFVYLKTKIVHMKMTLVRDYHWILFYLFVSMFYCATQGLSHYLQKKTFLYWSCFINCLYLDVVFVQNCHKNNSCISCGAKINIKHLN